MFLRGAIRSGTKGRRNAIFGATMATILSIPLILWGLPSNPPTGESGAAAGNGGSTCGTGSCHFHGTTATAGVITATNLTGTYTPGGAAIPITVTLGSDTAFGFEMSAVSGSGTSEVQAGSFTPGTGSDVAMGTTATDSGIQYIRQSSQGASFAFSWTPPGASVGTVTFNLAGVSSAGIIFATTFTMTPAAPPPPTPTLAASPTSLTFNMSGSAPPSQTVQITSGGTPIMTSITVSPTTATWLSVMPPGGNTPVAATVGIVGTPAAGTYNANIVITASGASNSPLSVPVTLIVTSPPPPTVPTLVLSSAGLNFTATAGGTTPAAQSVSVTASDSSAQTFNAQPSSTGNWLTVGGSTGMATGTTPTSESVGVVLTGLAAGTYQGSVRFTSTAFSNSPVTLPVTLTVNPSTPPPPTTTGESFRFIVVDRQSGGMDWLLLDGSGGINSTGTLNGDGFFTRFRSGSTRFGGTSSTVVNSGTLRPTSLVSFTPVMGTDDGRTIVVGGTMVLKVQITTHGVTTPSTGTLTIVSTGTTAGVTLAIDGGATFTPVGIGTQSIGNGGE